MSDPKKDIWNIQVRKEGWVKVYFDEELTEEQALESYSLGVNYNDVMDFDEISEEVLDNAE